MRKIILLLCVLVFTFGFALSNAEAKRFGGGKSFGTQRSINNNFSRTQPVQQAAKQSTASKWLAPLAGLAIGGLLASLLMGNGIGTGILTWLAIGLGIYLLLGLFRKKTQLQPQPLHQNQFREQPSEYKPSYNQNSPIYNSSPSVPADFDSESFLRDAKTKFIRLQAAYDQKNLNDLREFTTPEVFAEIQMQFQERGDTANQTDVISLNAEVLDVADEFNVLMASVRFSGLIREEVSQSPVSFNEIWHFRKDNTSSRWFVAGVQQHEITH